MRPLLHRDVAALLRMRLEHANPGALLSGSETLPGTVNYLVGNDPKRWRPHLAAYASVRCKSLYRGIDLLYNGDQRKLDCRFLVSAHANPGRIAMAFDGPEQVQRQPSGDLALTLHGDLLRWPRPVAFQNRDGHCTPVSARYVARGRCGAAIQVGKYDPTLPLVIDMPTELSYPEPSPNITSASLSRTTLQSTFLSQLLHWFRGGISGKRIAIVGDSTSDKTTSATPLYTELANYTATGQALAGVKILDFGSTGNTAANFLGGRALPGKTYRDLVAAAPALIVFSMGINDIRFGATSQSALTTTLTTILSNLRRDLPTTDIILRIPNAHSQEDTGAKHYVTTSSGVIVDQATNGNGAVAQTYSNWLWNAYKSLENTWPNVVLLDVQTAITGRTSPLTSAAGGMGDQIHPGVAEYQNIARAIVSIAGVRNITNPRLTYSTFLSGSNCDYATAVAVDSKQNIYIAGSAFSTDFPVGASGFQTVRKGAWSSFVTKLSADGSTLLYSTYLGGSGNGNAGDTATAIAISPQGYAFVTGTAVSPDFPVTAGAFQTQRKSPQGNAFVTKLSADGSTLLYSTYLGGSDTAIGDGGNAIATDTQGNAYIAGYTGSLDFPYTRGTRQAGNNGNRDGFVTKLSTTGAGLIYSAFLGGSQMDTCNAIAIDGQGDAYVAGYTLSPDFPVAAGAFQTSLGSSPQCVFVTKFSPNGGSLLYSTLLGGTQGASGDRGIGIALDSQGAAYITGSTSASDFPVTKGAVQTTLNASANSENAFVTKLNPSGTALAYSTLLGGTGASPGDISYGIAVDAQGNAYIAGGTTSPDFPVTAGAFQTSLKGTQNAFITALNATGSALLYSTFLGGKGNASSGDSAYGIALDGAGNTYVAGITGSPDFAITPGAVQRTPRSRIYSAFVSKLQYTAPTYFSQAPQIQATLGSTVVLSTTLNSSGTGLGLPAATVAFTLNGALLGTALTDSQGRASVTWSISNTLIAGMTYPVLIQFNGDATHGSSSTIGTIRITK